MDYTEIAKQLRIDTLSLIHKGQTSHIASCFSLTDIVAVLYENLKERDRVVWSKGWASALFYAVQARDGKIDKDDLYAKFPNPPYNALLEPSVQDVGIATGSVGHGLSFAVGIALAKKRKGEKGTVYCLMSDGELNEGSVWEAVMLASHHKLDNLVAIIDKNGWQAMGKTEDVIYVEPLRAFGGFNWDVYETNGHNHITLEKIFKQWIRIKPFCIVAETIKGKGVSFMENHLLYHYKNIDDETYAKALTELKNA